MAAAYISMQLHGRTARSASEFVGHSLHEGG